METILGFPQPPDANVERGAQLFTLTDFLETTLGAERPLVSTCPFVGREEMLAALIEFANATNAAPGGKVARIAVILGRAGTGKSSLLAAFAAAYTTLRKGASLRFATDAAQGAGPSAQRLPPGRCLVLLDDANQTAAIWALLRMAVERPEDVRLVLATRPSRLTRLRALFAQAGLEADEIRVLPELGPLPPAEAEALAREVLGENNQELAAPLAAAAGGSPFTIALGGKLLSEEALHPVALAQPEGFAGRALDRAHDVLLLRAAVSIEPRLLGSVLALIAALSPVRTSDERFLQGAGELLSCRRRDLVLALRGLESAHLLERGALGSRIVPGPLADHALHRALAGTGPLTGTTLEHAQAIARLFGVHALVPLLANASSLDGPSTPEGASSEIAGALFRYVRGELEAASAPDRCRLLSAMRELAGAQPSALIELTEVAMRRPTTSDGSTPSGALFSQATVLYELPAILRRVSDHIEHIPRAADLLWELGRDDLRLQSPHPDHPMRVLRDLASSAKACPKGVHEALLDAVDRWLREDSAHEHKHSPLDVLETFLADSAASSDGVVDEDRRRALRDRALSALFRCARQKERLAALAGVSGLERVLSEAMGSLFSELEEPAWRESERHEILRMLREAASGSADPLVHFAAAEALSRVSRHRASDSLRDDAEAALAEVPESYERRLYEALTPAVTGARAGRATERAFPGGGLDAPPSAERRFMDACKPLVNELLARHPSPEGPLAALGAALEELSLAGKSGSPRLMLHVLSRSHPRDAAGICEAMLKSPEGPLAPHVASLLHALRSEDPPRASGLVAAIVAGSDPTLCASLAQVFHRWVERPIEGDQEALRKLLAHRDGFVRRAALGALRTLALSSPRDAVDLAVGVDLCEGPEVAEALFGALDAGGLFTASALSDEEVILFLSRLLPARSLDGHSTMRFLHHAGKRLPDQVAELLVDRIAQSEGRRDGADGYEPLPPESLQSILSSLPRSPLFLTILRRIRDLACGRGGFARFHAARLFHDASQAFSRPSVEVLEEWVAKGAPEELEAVAVLLEEAPPALLFAHLDMISSLVDRAHTAGGACFEGVRRGLFSVATGQTRPRASRPILGESTLKEQAREAALRLPWHSPAQRFFESLAKHAEAALVQEDAEQDDELFDL